MDKNILRHLFIFREQTKQNPAVHWMHSLMAAENVTLPNAREDNANDSSQSNWYENVRQSMIRRQKTLKIDSNEQIAGKL